MANGKAVSKTTLDALKNSDLGAIQIALEMIPVTERTEVDTANLHAVKQELSLRRRQVAAKLGRDLLAKLK